MAGEVLGKGAEALVYMGILFNRAVVVKQRVRKPYRHELFDRLFRYTRTKTEAKVLARLYSAGLNVPAPLIVDLKNYVIVMEFIRGDKMTDVVDSLSIDELKDYMYKLGLQVGVMHSLDIYHGDLTLSNVIVRDGDLYIIDFGLAGFSKDVEEYAIDLHLLKRNLVALIPDHADTLFNDFLKGYRERYEKEYELVIERLRDVELRGRYVEERLKKKARRDRYVDQY